MSYRSPEPVESATRHLSQVDHAHHGIGQRVDESEDDAAGHAVEHLEHMGVVDPVHVPLLVLVVRDRRGDRVVAGTEADRLESEVAALGRELGLRMEAAFPGGW